MMCDLTEKEVWHAGEDGIETYYIYGLAASGQTVFAFAEARIERHDKGPHHIVLKRSFDQGQTWEKNQFLVKSKNGECFANPVPVIDRASGKLHLFYGRNFDNESAELKLISSDDNGETWSGEFDLTHLFDDNEHGWTMHLPGPGHGIQTRCGRMIVPVWHRRRLELPPNERRYGISMILSDDGGTTWSTGGMVPVDDSRINESRIVELPNDDLILNARSGAFVTSDRFASRSSDSGSSWSRPEAITSLTEVFATDAGFIAVDSELVLTRPAGVNSREDLTVYLSDDEMKTWTYSRAIYSGPAGYSDAVNLGDGSVGVLYGRDLLAEDIDVEGNVRQTMFAKFDLSWIKEL